MQTSLRRKHRDRVVRRGLALIIESDFYATDAGRQHFADQLTSIRYCVQETCNFDALYAYLSTSNYDFNYDRAKNLRPKRNIKTAMNHEIMLYGIAQKDQMGFDKAVEECKYRAFAAASNRHHTTPPLGTFLTVLVYARRHVALRRLPEHARAPAPDAPVHGARAGAET